MQQQIIKDPSSFSQKFAFASTADVFLSVLMNSLHLRPPSLSGIPSQAASLPWIETGGNRMALDPGRMHGMGEL